MKKLIHHRTTVVWLALSLATIITGLLGSSRGGGGNSAGIAVIAITFLKVRFVMQDFMELRHAPRIMALVADAWVALTCFGLIGLYAWGGSSAG